MENNFKGTSGEVKKSKVMNFSDTLVVYIESEVKEIAQLRGCTTGEEIEAEANAQLITDAFNIRQQINCDLPEFFERYNKAVELLGSLEPNLRLNSQEEIDKWKSVKNFLKTLE